MIIFMDMVNIEEKANCKPSLVVIPAKAGIQESMELRDICKDKIQKSNKGTNLINMEKTSFVSWNFWIPAFAGMTKREEFFNSSEGEAL